MPTNDEIINNTVKEMEYEAFRLEKASLTPRGVYSSSTQAIANRTLARKLRLWIWELKNGVFNEFRDVTDYRNMEASSAQNAR